MNRSHVTRFAGRIRWSSPGIAARPGSAALYPRRDWARHPMRCIRDEIRPNAVVTAKLKRCSFFVWKAEAVRYVPERAAMRRVEIDSWATGDDAGRIELWM